MFVIKKVVVFKLSIILGLCRTSPERIQPPRTSEASGKVLEHQNNNEHTGTQLAGENDWILIAKTLDRLFFGLFLAAYVVSTAVIMSRMMARNV